MARKKPDEHCNECGARVEPIFAPTRYHDDWIYRNCDRCRETICEDCSDWREETNERICVTCLIDEKVKREGM